jgi:hypothetical protein
LSPSPVPRDAQTSWHDVREGHRSFGPCRCAQAPYRHRFLLGKHGILGWCYDMYIYIIYIYIYIYIYIHTYLYIWIYRDFSWLLYKL